MKLLEKFCAALTAALILSIPYFAFAAPGQWLLQTGGGASGGGGVVPALVKGAQSCRTVTFPGTQAATTCPIQSTGAGNTLIVGFEWCDVGNCSSTATRTAISTVVACSGTSPCTSGDSCTLFTSSTAVVDTGTAESQTEIWWCAVSAGDTRITATWAAPVGNGIIDPVEVSGVLTSSSPEDGVGTNTLSSGTSLTCTLGTTTTQTNDFIYAIEPAAFSTNTPSVDAPFTLMTTTVMGSAWYVDASLSAPAAAFHWSAANFSLCSIAAFKHS